MGRFIKNATIPTGSYAIRLPVGTSSLGPSAPVNGQVRFNESNSRVEMYFAGVWNQIAKIGNVSVVVDDLVSIDGTTTDFTMSQPVENAEDVVVFIGGVYQLPGTHYTVSSWTISFTSPPPAPSLPVSPNRINIIHNLNSTDAA